jgi:hypothetical protein
MSILRSPEDLTVFFSSELIHMEAHLDSRWIPGGVHMDFVQNCRLRSFSDGLHLDSTWVYGVQVDSIWNLWGRVNYTVKYTIIS